MGEQVGARTFKCFTHLKLLLPQKGHNSSGVTTDGGVAQLGEHLPCKQGVMSSNLTISISQGNLMNCTLKTEY